MSGLAATALNDTTIALSWQERMPAGYDYHAIFADTVDGFLPAEDNLLATVPASTNTFQHHPVEGCWFYRVCIVDDSGYSSGYSNQESTCTSGVTTGDPDLPSFVNALYQNYPNPFNGNTTIKYSLADKRSVDIRIYDTAGRLIRTLFRGEKDAGVHTAAWNGKDNASRPVTSGVYFLKIAAGDFSSTRKIVYLR